MKNHGAEGEWGDGIYRRSLLIGAAFGLGGIAVGMKAASADDDTGLSHSAEAIHQEPVFQASRERLYRALTDAKEFDHIVELSGVLQEIGAKAAGSQLMPEAGTAFSLFAGYITGRQLELLPNERIVQAWRSQSWKPGEFSIVRFNLVEQGSGTRIVFDHAGFPAGEGEHLAAGWESNYWTPMAKYFAATK